VEESWSKEDVAYLLRGTIAGGKHSELERFMNAELPQRLSLGRPLRVKLGLDPKTPSLHVGHLAPLLCLKRFQDKGHKTFLLLGGFTARFGDPSGRREPRAPLSQEEIHRNAQVYEEQAFRILDRSKTVLVNNSVWFDDMDVSTLMADVLRPLSLAVALSHGPFRNRYEANEPVSVVELLYTALQAYDSMVVCAAKEGKEDDPAEYRDMAGTLDVCCDVEIGGEDQIFNFGVTRRLMHARHLPEEIPVVLEYVTGARDQPIGPGRRRYIPLNLDPDDLYKAIVAVPDKSLLRTFRSITDLSDDEIASMKDEIGRDPHSLRKLLARAVVRLAHGEEAASLAERAYETHPRGEPVPKSAVVLTGEEAKAEMGAIVLVQAAGFASGVREAEFLLSEGSIFLNDKPLAISDELEIVDGAVLQRGRGLWAKAVLIRVAPVAIVLPYSMLGKPVDAVDLAIMSGAARNLQEAETLLKQRRVFLGGIELGLARQAEVRDGILVEVVGEDGQRRPVARLDLPE